jgi:hypothetical protein
MMAAGVMQAVAAQVAALTQATGDSTETAAAGTETFGLVAFVAVGVLAVIAARTFRKRKG